MSTKVVITGTIVLLLLVFGISIVIWGIGVYNKDIDYRTRFAALDSDKALAHDNMWKTISQKYQIADAYKDGFVKSIDAAVEGRKGGSLFKSVQENMTGLSPEVYKDVMATIEGKRDMFMRVQQIQVDIVREDDNLRNKFPTSIIVGGKPQLVAKIITSTNTVEAVRTGVDDNINLTGKKIAQ